MNRTVGIFGILIGTMMIVQWSYFLATGQVPEIRSEPLRLAFHLVGEFLTAFGLLVSGMAVLKRIKWGKLVLLVSNGLLIYSVIVSPGYFAQTGQWEMVTMFMVILALTIVVTYFVARELIKSI